MILGLLLCFQLSSQGYETVSGYLRSGGAKLCSNLAHPTNTFKKASWTYSGSNVILTMVSHDNWFDRDVVTKVSFPILANGQALGRHRLIKDDDFGAYEGVSLLKEVLNETIRESYRDSDRAVGEIERFFGKTILYMDAYDTAGAITCCQYWVYLAGL